MENKKERIPTVNIEKETKDLIRIYCAENNIRIINYVTEILKEDLRKKGYTSKNQDEN